MYVKNEGRIENGYHFLFLMVFVAAGISIFSKASKTSFVYRSKEPLKIGATYMTLNNPFFSIIDEEIHNVVEANGDVLISLDPALDLEKQNNKYNTSLIRMSKRSLSILLISTA